MEVVNPAVESIVKSYISKYLRKIGYEWNENQPLSNCRMCIALTTVSDEFNLMYREQIVNLGERLSFEPSTAKNTFLGVVNELFCEGITWSRIVCLFVFGGEISVYCMQRDWPELVDDLVIWITSYISTHLQEWINEHGGWEGLVTFANNRKNGHNQTGRWTNLKTLVCTVAAGMVGLTFAGALSSKT